MFAFCIIDVGFGPGGRGFWGFTGRVICILAFRVPASLAAGIHSTLIYIGMSGCFRLVWVVRGIFLHIPGSLFLF